MIYMPGMLLNDISVPAGLTVEPFSRQHTLALRYTNRLLVDDVAGESIPDGLEHSDVVCVSDLPPSTKVIRPGMPWPQGLVLPNDTIVIVIDENCVISYVGHPESSAQASPSF